MAGEVSQCCWDSRAASLQLLSQALRSSSVSEAQLRSSTVSSHRKETSSKEATKKLLAAQMLPSKTEAAMKNKVQFDNFIFTLVVFGRTWACWERLGLSHGGPGSSWLLDDLICSLPLTPPPLYKWQMTTSPEKTSYGCLCPYQGKLKYPHFHTLKFEALFAYFIDFPPSPLWEENTPVYQHYPH